ncbi:TetR/AcrR family transcriptional regulator [Amycolatopsis sp. GM8]|uniref:TetR/AcrR family transcriptional regulator n=1 Tax=Amycolatopsis sp. GM8 TaxID=2896530 RepID=UPI001F31F059|nr:TetR/AcrR family transcriptional regulator [Amycolatopsis sp. GM8]
MTSSTGDEEVSFTPLPPQERGRRRRAQIVDAAWDLIDVHGHKSDSVSIREIGRTAGTSTGTIYHYFRDLDEIVAAVADLYRQRLLEATQLPQDGGDWRTSIVDSHRRFVDFFARYPGLRGLWFDSQASPYVRLIHREFRNTLTQRHRDRLGKLTRSPLALDDCVIAITMAGALYELAFSRDPQGDPRVIARLDEVVQDFYARRLDARA